MKVATRVAAVGAVLFLIGAPDTRADEQEDLIAKRDKKLQSEFISKADWVLDYDEARNEAAKTDKLIFGYFTRSYAP